MGRRVRSARRGDRSSAVLLFDAWLLGIYLSAAPAASAVVAAVAARGTTGMARGRVRAAGAWQVIRRGTVLRIPVHHLRSIRQNQPHRPLFHCPASHFVHGGVDKPCGQRHVRAGGPWRPGDVGSQTLHDRDCRLDAVLVKPISAPSAAQPQVVVAVDAGQGLLRGAAVERKDRMVQREVPHRFVSRGWGCGV